MKYILKIFISLVFMPLLFSQNIIQNDKIIEVIYVKAFKKHDDTSKNPPKTLKGLEYKLLCNNIVSRFEYLPIMSIEGGNDNRRFIGRSGGSGIYYKDLKSNIKLHQRESLDEKTYLINENPINYNWKLLKESKIILNYKCFKAVGTYEDYSYIRKQKITLTITAWYAPSLPISFGPSGYDGLPGLVLEASRSSFYFIASSITFNNNTKNIKIQKPERGKAVTLKEFNEILYKSMLKITNQ